MINRVFSRKTGIAFIAAVFIFSGCSSQKTDKQEHVQKVQAAQVTEMNVPIFIKSFGNLSAGSHVDVKAQVTGEIIKSYFKSGSFVKQGELLLEIDPSAYKAKLDNDLAAYQYDKSDYNLKKYFVAKNKNLVTSGAYPQQDYQKLLTDLEMAGAKLKLDQANIDADKINLDHCYVKAPISGITGINGLNEGDFVSVNDTLLNINDNSYLYIDFPIPESNYSRIKSSFDKKELGIGVTVFALSKDGSSKEKKQIPANIEYLNNTTDSTSSTITLEAKIDNSNGTLLPEQFAYVTLQIGELKNATVVPTNAVQTDNTGNYIYTVGKDNKVTKINIVQGIQFENYTVIKSGKIDINSLVVTVGADSVAQNSTVNIIKIDKKTA